MHERLVRRQTQVGQVGEAEVLARYLPIQLVGLKSLVNYFLLMFLARLACSDNRSLVMILNLFIFVEKN